MSFVTGLRCLVVAWALTASLRAQEPPAAVTRLRSVEIHCADVFSESGAAENPVYGLANALHVITDESVVAREVWFEPGDRITAADAAEIERNLRALGLFGAVRVELRPASDGWSDLVIDARDRFSLSASASVSRVGGIDKAYFRLSDSNLFGTGKSLAVGITRTSDQRAEYLRYTDPQLLGSLHFLDVLVGTSDEGDYTNVTLTRPRRRLADPFTYGGSFAHVDEHEHYYGDTETVAEVPNVRDELRLFGAAIEGPRERRRTIGLDLRSSRRVYDPAFGVDAGSVRVPGDTRQLEFGPYWAYDWRPRFDVVRRLDALDYDEDVTLGMHLGVRLAGRWRDETGMGNSLQPVLDTTARTVFAPVSDCYVALSASTEARFEAGRARGRTVSGAAHACWLGLPAHSFVFRAKLDDVVERQDLTPQLTLGEDNGLRGYPARFLVGSRRALLNFEDRIDTGIEVLSVHVGVAAFCDVGWMDDPGPGRALGSSYGGVGVGLRFGSSHLVGRQVFRLDFSWPLEGDRGVSVSFALGQVFDFLDDTTNLGR